MSELYTQMTTRGQFLNRFGPFPSAARRNSSARTEELFVGLSRSRRGTLAVWFGHGLFRGLTSEEKPARCIGSLLRGEDQPAESASWRSASS